MSITNISSTAYLVCLTPASLLLNQFSFFPAQSVPKGCDFLSRSGIKCFLVDAVGGTLDTKQASNSASPTARKSYREENSDYFFEHETIK